MAFFSKLFEKKECAICGGEIGLLGNRKLEDGNLCKNCAAKLSPWFDDRRNSTVAQISAQLAYREANKEKVAAFNATRVFGEYTKLYLDENACEFMVTSANANNIAQTNPDVIACADIMSCVLDIDENKVELYTKDKEGKQISYNPPRYRYDYEFYIELKVKNPYFDDIRFKLNNNPVCIETHTPQRTVSAGTNRFLNNSIRGVNPELNVQYKKYKAQGEEIKEALMNARNQVKEEKPVQREQAVGAMAAAAPQAKVICAYCGAETIPDAAGNCEYCGAPALG